MHVRTKARFAVVLLSLTVFLGGCSRSRTPAALSQRIAGADRVLVWDWAHMDHLSIEGEGVTKLVKAVSAAKGGNRKYSAQYGKTIEFYQGSNFLARIRFQQDVLKTEEGEYYDGTGVLKTLDRRFSSEEATRKNGVNKLAADVVTKPELRDIQIWSEELLWRYKSGNFKTNFYKGTTELINEAVPDWLKAAWPRPPDISLGEGPLGTVRCVFLEWAGSCGLAVGDASFVPASTLWGGTNFHSPNYLTSIMPGVYAYHQ